MKKLTLNCILIAANATFTAPAIANANEYDDLVARFGSAEENFRIDKTTHAHWTIEFPEPCVIRRRTTTYISRDGRLDLSSDEIERVNLSDITEESFVHGEGASMRQITMSCADHRQCASSAKADSIKDENGLSGTYAVKALSEDHMTIRLGLSAYKLRRQILQQIAAICRSRQAPSP